MDFQSFAEIENVSSIQFSITQKLHGTNACVFIFQTQGGSLDLKCGSRTRWVTPGDDNYGFATFVYQHKDEFIAKLGEGRHYGEWVGPQIGSSEGLTEKTLVLFAWWRFTNKLLPPRTRLVPVLYNGPVDMEQIAKCILRRNETRFAEKPLVRYTGSLKRSQIRCGQVKLLSGLRKRWRCLSFLPLGRTTRRSASVSSRATRYLNDQEPSRTNRTSRRRDP